ncbi:hypothetical protein AB7340_20295 [Providencia alcalifaciens]
MSNVTHLRPVQDLPIDPNGRGFSGGGSGGGNMESRVARLEASVENIQSNMSDAKSDIRVLTSDVSDIKTTLAVLVQKIDGVTNSISDIKTSIAEVKGSVSSLPTSEVINELSDKISKRPNEDKINTKFIEVNSKIELAAEKAETKIKDVRLQIILWILGLPSVVFGVYKLYQALTIAQ